MDHVVVSVLALIVIGIVLFVPIGLTVGLARLRRLESLADRVAKLEALVQKLSASGNVAQASSAEMPPAPAPIPVAPVAQRAVPAPAASAGSDPLPFIPARTLGTKAVEATTPVLAGAAPSASALETFIGRKALGWVAVVVLLFATAFFLRYAFENQWVGPLGRVTMGILAGLTLAHFGHRYYLAGWRTFSQMLTAAGVVLLYLSTYSAFGFYHLLDQRAAAMFLAVIVVESALLALWYDSPAVALMAVVGGLLSPVLMQSDRDQYVALFGYLIVLNVGVVGLLLRRAWPLVGSVALVGTQALFSAWYIDNYHPQKLAWALGFQLVIFGLYLGLALLRGVVRRRREVSIEDAMRLVGAPIMLSAAAYALLDDDYHEWLGSLAVGMAALYAVVARVGLRAGGRSALALVAVGIASGFVALAIPLQADAPWVALGWAAEAAVLWWFGLRIRSVPLRAFAAVFAAMAALQILAESPLHSEPGAMLILNRQTLPALAAVACLVAGLARTRRFVERLSESERALIAVAAVACTLLVWYVVSLDIAAYFGSPGRVAADSVERMTQMSLSAWWAVYATAVLAVGFKTRLGLLRWTSLGLYALTIGKVFLYDMDGLDQIYRIVAFFVLAALLGAAAWAYQRFQPDAATER